MFPFPNENEHDIVIISTRYELDVEVSFFYNVYTMTHGLSFNNELTKDPIWPFWNDF